MPMRASLPARARSSPRRLSRLCQRPPCAAQGADDDDDDDDDEESGDDERDGGGRSPARLGPLAKATVAAGGTGGAQLTITVPAVGVLDSPTGRCSPVSMAKARRSSFSMGSPKAPERPAQVLARAESLSDARMRAAMSRSPTLGAWLSFGYSRGYQGVKQGV
jgi:hypothetical protein